MKGKNIAIAVLAVYSVFTTLAYIGAKNAIDEVEKITFDNTWRSAYDCGQDYWYSVGYYDCKNGRQFKYPGSKE